MTTLRRSIPKLTILILALAGLAVPASATITYTSCSTGCSSSTGTYAAWQTASGSAGLTFSMTPATFAPGNLTSGVYTDPTGTVLTGYNGASIDTLMSVSGSSLLQSVSGLGSGIQIQLPANTYALAFDVTTISGSGFTTFAEELGDHNVFSTNYNTNVPSGGSVQFFGIISSTPITELFVGPFSSGGRLQINDFELGEFSPGASTPELPSVALIGGGLVLFGLLRRRVHKPRGAVA
jgi:hypothetical protein